MTILINGLFGLNIQYSNRVSFKNVGTRIQPE
jgi:hypothetical protein